MLSSLSHCTRQVNLRTCQDSVAVIQVTEDNSWSESLATREGSRFLRKEAGKNSSHGGPWTGQVAVRPL